jgi:TPR repeat protein
MARMAGWEELEDSAMAGDEVAAFELAMCHASGSGGLRSVDLIQAHRWFNVAAALGYAPAASWRGEIAAEMSARQVVEAQKLARATLATRLQKAA